jgi:hypothetical protein
MNFKGYNVVKKPTSHIINEIAALPKKEQVQALQQFATPTVKAVLKLACDPKLKFALPEGETPYKPNDLGDDWGILPAEMRRMYLFLEGGQPNLKTLRREQLWVEFMQYINPDDAKLMDLVKDKKLPEGLTEATVKKAFPDLF